MTSEHRRWVVVAASIATSLAIIVSFVAFGGRASTSIAAEVTPSGPAPAAETLGVTAPSLQAQAPIADPAPASPIRNVVFILADDPDWATSVRSHASLDCSSRG